MLMLDFATATEVCQQLGQRLRAQRLAQLLTQAELAARAGVALGTVRKLEGSGQSSVESLVRVVQALGLVAELQNLWAQPPQSIAQMVQAEQASRRQRAPKRSLKRPSKPEPAGV